jgi:RIO kinase 2
MKLDITQMRYLTAEDYRLLAAIETGMSMHDIVPLTLIARYAKSRPGEARRRLADLCRLKLISLERSGTEDLGARLGYGGYDYLALRALLMSGALTSLGRQIGVGKESDLYEANDGRDVLKLQRLGRTSFRQVKNLRDYHQGRRHISWLYLSRLGAQREFRALQALHAANFPVPEPVGHSRHAVLMRYVPGTRLDQVGELREPKSVLLRTLHILSQLMRQGVVHGDFNEFNLMVVDDGHKERVVAIDLPQLIPMTDVKARAYFERDLHGVLSFFGRKYGMALSEEEQAVHIPIFPEPLPAACPLLTYQDSDTEEGGVVDPEHRTWTLVQDVVDKDHDIDDVLDIDGDIDIDDGDNVTTDDGKYNLKFE